MTTNTHSFTPRIIKGLAIAMLLFSPRASSAASGTWTGGGGDGNWQTNTNWSASPFPGNASNVYTSAEIATFGVVGSSAVNLGGTLNIGSVVFGGGGVNAGAFSLGDANDILNLTSAGSISVRGGVISNQIVGVPGTVLSLSTSANSTYSFLNFGTGTLTVGGDVTANQGVGNTSILTLGGSGNGTISGILSNAGLAGTAGLSVVKNGSGTWTLSGANTFTGASSVNGGRLVLDYTTNDPVSTAPVTVSGGALDIKGNSAGTTETISSLVLGSSVGSVSKLTLDANGGDGVDLTIDTFNAGTAGAIVNLIDLSSSSSNSIAINALGASAAVANGVLMSGNSFGNRSATIVVRDSSGYGFATISGATSGTLGRLTAGTELTDSNATTTNTNVRLTAAGTVTRTANVNYNTLTIDSTAGDITLDMGAFNFATSQGRGILVTGTNDTNIIGTGNLGSVALFSNYGSGTLSVSLAGSTSGLLFAGTGFSDYSGLINASSSIFTVGGGIVRLSRDQTLPNISTGYLVAGGGVLEIGADLNGATAGDFNKAIGTASGNIRFTGDSGLSAAGTDRVVNFGGSGATITWGSNAFLTNVDGTTDGGYTFKLSSVQSNAKLTIQNGIALGSNTSRVVDVANGTAAIDATLSGTLSGSGAILTKTGTGTLELTAANTYSGGTVVSAGTLLINNASGSGAGTGNVNVNDGGTLGGTGALSGAVIVNDGGTLKPGASIETLGSGALTMNDGSTLGSELDSNVASSVGADLLKVSGDLTFSGTVELTLTDIAAVPVVFAPGTTFTLINYTGTWNNGLLTYAGNAIADGGTFTAGLTTWQLDYNSTTGGSNFPGEYIGGQFVNITSVVPEPSSAMLTFLGSVGVVLWLRRRR